MSKPIEAIAFTKHQPCKLPILKCLIFFVIVSLGAAFAYEFLL